MKEVITTFFGVEKRQEINMLKFKEWKIPYLKYQQIETDPELKEIYMLRAELDYKYFVLKGITKKLYNEEVFLPDILKIVKEGKNVILFDINKSFSHKQIEIARSRSELITGKD